MGWKLSCFGKTRNAYRIWYGNLYKGALKTNAETILKFVVHENMNATELVASSCVFDVRSFELLLLCDRESLPSSNQVFTAYSTQWKYYS